MKNTLSQKLSLRYAAMLSLCLAICSCDGSADPVESKEHKTIFETLMVSPDDPWAADPAHWPSYQPVFPVDDEIETRLNAILSAMSVEEKVGQVIQADIAFVTPEEVRKYNLGSVLNGGNSAPEGNVRAAPQSWLDLVDEYWQASTDRRDGGVGIPILWGTDAVHGHNNVIGATIFPHNIGLGAANNPALIERIGQATAKEVLATGMDWTFAPSVAVARDDRWGRAYESFSEAPGIVEAYSGAYVRGLQGDYQSDEFLNTSHVIATAKHFLGDGGTVNGRDQGDAVVSEAELRDIHAAGYPPAIQNGVQVIMASYNAFNGHKMHAHPVLLDDILRGRFGFDGFVVGDWNGHGQVEGCTNISCAASFLAGVDMFMAPDGWKELYYDTLEEVETGIIPMARLDEAVSRILRVKLRAGLFDAGAPSTRPGAGDWSVLNSHEHKALARQAVRQSLVLLKNNDSVLPLSPALSVLVAGDGADNIAKQSGGWTYSWQGTGNSNADFPNGESIFKGVERYVVSHGGRAVLSRGGAYDEKPDVAIVVFGELPYAEYRGDVADLDFRADAGLALLKRFKADGIKTVAIFLSGRPMFVNPELNAADAFIAAWLPGDQGGGVADVLFTDNDGAIRHDFKGRLAFSWPRAAKQKPLNIGDDDYNPLFPYGYGLSYNAPHENLAQLPEETGLTSIDAAGNQPFFQHGDATGVWRMGVKDALGETQVTSRFITSADNMFSARKANSDGPLDSRILTWRGPARFSIFGNDVDLSPHLKNDMALSITLSAPPSDNIGETKIAMACGYGCEGALDATKALRSMRDRKKTTLTLPLACFANRGAQLYNVTGPLVIESAGPLTLNLVKAELVPQEDGGKGCMQLAL